MAREGWFFPKTKRVRVYHYGIEGRRRSLCGRYDTPGPHLLFPEVNHQKCLSCIQRLRELKWRREDAKAIHLLNETELAIVALRDHISDLLSLFKFDRVEGIIEEIEKLYSTGTEVDRGATKQDDVGHES